VVIAGPSGAIGRADDVVLAVSMPDMIGVAMPCAATPFAFSGCDSDESRRLKAGILDLPFASGFGEVPGVSVFTPGVCIKLPDDCCRLWPPVFSAINIALLK
jgi:hypothetical protein